MRWTLFLNLMVLLLWDTTSDRKTSWHPQETATTQKSPHIDHLRALLSLTLKHKHPTLITEVPQKLLDFCLQKLFLGSSFPESQLQSKTAFGRCKKNCTPWAATGILSHSVEFIWKSHSPKHKLFQPSTMNIIPSGISWLKNVLF